MRDAFLATVDADGVLYVWDRRGSRVMEHVTRSKVSALAPFWIDKGAQPTYVALAANGMVKIFDFERGSFAYIGQVKAGSNGYIAVKDILFDHVKHVFIISDQDGRVHVVTAPSQETLRAGQNASAAPHDMLAASIKVDGSRFSVTPGSAQTDIAKIRDLPTVSLLSQSPDLKYLAVSAAGAPSTICLFSFADGFGPCIKRHVKEIDVAGDRNIDDFAFVDKCL